mgnify:CR=1 FL=1
MLSFGIDRQRAGIQESDTRIGSDTQLAQRFPRKTPRLATTLPYQIAFHFVIHTVLAGATSPRGSTAG